jgi:hypothetical protein
VRLIILAFLNAGLVFTSVLSAIVLYKQWQTFEKTDRTLRIGERAFVYMQGVNFLKFPTGSLNSWYILPQAENNGTTQTVGMTYRLLCDKVSSQTAKVSFGPKQISGIGGCLYDLTNLWLTHNPARVSGLIFYEDVFMQSHVTRFCRNIFIQTDPTQARSVGDLSQTSELCPDAPDCADKECIF